MLFFNNITPTTPFRMAIAENTKAMFGVGDFAKKIAEPAKHTAEKKLIAAPTLQFLLDVAFINVCLVRCRLTSWVRRAGPLSHE